MNVSTSLNPGARAAQTSAAPVRRITDAPTRMFHWLFALCFVGAYATADGEHWRLLHVTLGYTMAGLVAKGDIVVVTLGAPVAAHGSTNLLKLHRVGHILS